MPRVLLVPANRAASGERAAFAIVKNPDFDPRATVVVEAPGPVFPPGPLGDARAQIVEEAPRRLVIETTAGRAAWLVVNDTFAPGWRARVDGRPAEVSRANALVRAVPLEAGAHRVELDYAPRSLVVGAAVSGVSLLVLGGLILGPRWRRRRLGAAAADAIRSPPSTGGPA